MWNISNSQLILAIGSERGFEIFLKIIIYFLTRIYGVYGNFKGSG